MNSRMLVIAGAVVALGAPTAATARTTPIKPHAKQVLVKKKAAQQTPKLAKQQSRPRVLCICIVDPGPLPPPISEEEFERQYDEDMIAHGLDPVYGIAAAAQTATG
jgi:hypothetical protein